MGPLPPEAALRPLRRGWAQAVLGTGGQNEGPFFPLIQKSSDRPYSLVVVELRI